MFGKRDIEEITGRGQSVESVYEDLEKFKKGFPPLDVKAAATPEKGIKITSESEQKKAIENYDSYSGGICKFVPASGAATRMFKDIFSELEMTKGRNDPVTLPASEKLKESLGKFAFYDDLKAFPTLNQRNAISCAEHLLCCKGLNYSDLPKGLIKFHSYKDGARTPFEEQLVEGALYAKTKEGVSKIIFSVSPEHREKFETLFKSIKERYQSRFDVVYDLRFSLQKASTDKIAADENNRPFRKDDGSLLFRPAGHGALIENLNEIEDEIVIIKNIDNVVREEYLHETVRWKKVLLGLLLELRDKIFKYLDALEGDDNKQLNNEVTEFMKRELNITVPSLPDSLVRLFLKEKLNRPIRVCGMVKNTGEAGGGPYIVTDPDGSLSPQILEGAQLDTSNSFIKDIVSNSTHFNPVDIVCCLRNYRGEKFDLHKYTDPETGFISIKSLNGKEIKALELPGLWNGTMSQWNTLFVEVPLITFNPVKTVFDLLRKEHVG